MLTVRAPAKVNLTLEVLGRRPDGYHEIRSVMQAVSLADRLTFGPAPDGAITLAGGSAEAPPDDSNLVLRAARALAESAGVTYGAAMTLEKHIPAGAGLGGGSSDAAATLLALCRLWDLDIPSSSLSDIAAGLGSDVPFFLTEGTALAEGRGERLTNLRPAAGLWLALAKPAASLPTPAVYAAFASGGVYRADDGTQGLLDALRSGSVERVGHCLRNDLQPAALTLCPEIGDVLALMLQSGAVAAQVSGSGSACFALCRDRDGAESIAAAAGRRGWWSVAARTAMLPLEVD